MINYEDVTLSKKDKQTLRTIHKNGAVDVKQLDCDVMAYLLDLDLIEYDYRTTQCFMVLTPNYERYLLSKKNRFIERKFPIILSIIAIMISVIALYISVLSA